MNKKDQYHSSKFEYIVTEEDKGQPVKALIRSKFTFSSRLMSKLKRGDFIYVNGNSAKLYLPANPGDVISIVFPEEKSDFLPEPIDITPVFEDKDLLIINKQPGYVVHPTKGHPVHTMANGIMKYMLDTNQSFKIRFINRLDMDTSGLLVVAKNSHSQDEFTKQMKENKVAKKYVALVKGTLSQDTGTIDLPLGRPDAERVERGVMEDGHPSVTHYTVLKRYDKGYTLVELLLETGRTHQIRVHLSHIGYPVVGDHLYGGENPWLIERQALHARYLSFYHPVTGEFMEVEAPLPQDILDAIEKVK
ncbi:RluA family pseudouridine synthase [Clostridium aminobutyricum]|uniref:Pseudouridine synthase n=1 Tax=Clostridium aminobutyricum TaxID=33953 RepID=A0A939D6Y6_CLOAM|nr:RluA family pseudouridine synthase [Clostridium aminobutyricum]MBN7772205.1 RluA family pseudouridine synthase [Clostridium aminobutyricum]